MNFQTTSYGKCIIAGEHTVLRGGRALVYPLIHKKMDFHWEQSDADLNVNFEGDEAKDLHLIFFSLLEEAVKKLKISRNKLLGTVTITSNLPLGAGLGASAAICVATTKWLSHLGYVATNEIFEFARELENLFHGESSGADIAVSLAGKPIIFDKKTGFTEFKPKWWPNWYLSYSGKKGVTSDCVKKVQKLIVDEPIKAAEIDLSMKKSVEDAIQALSVAQDRGEALLADALVRAEKCFEAWGLTEGVLETKMIQLTNAGALAVKPTGSGSGGFVLHLWSENKSPKMMDDSIPLSN